MKMQYGNLFVKAYLKMSLDVKNGFKMENLICLQGSMQQILLKKMEIMLIKQYIKDPFCTNYCRLKDIRWGPQ